MSSIGFDGLEQAARRLESCCSASACAVSEREESRKDEEQRSRHRFLMCPPTHFAVRYVINAWMSLDAQPEPTLARQQWEDLRATIEKCGAEVCRILSLTLTHSLTHSLTLSLSGFVCYLRRSGRAGNQADRDKSNACCF